MSAGSKYGNLTHIWSTTWDKTNIELLWLDDGKRQLGAMANGWSEARHEGEEGQVVEGGDVELPDDGGIYRVLGNLVKGPWHQAPGHPGHLVYLGQQQQKRLPPLLALDTSSQRWSLSHRFWRVWVRNLSTFSDQWELDDSLGKPCRG